MRYDGRVLARVMGVLESIGAWCEQPSSKLREQDEETVYSLEKIGERLPPEILHSDSVGTDLVASYTKKFACSQERVIEWEGTGLRKQARVHSQGDTGKTREASLFVSNIVHHESIRKGIY